MASVCSGQNLAVGRKWPLSGGVRSEITSPEEKWQELVCIVGYHDGSVRIWDSSNPIFPLVSTIEGQVSVPSNSKCLSAFL